MDKTGGAAFPRPISIEPNSEVAWDQEGMTLWDYHAAEAMQALIPALLLRYRLTGELIADVIKEAAAYSSMAADAMIAERGNR